jgi:hypothetical protein
MTSDRLESQPEASNAAGQRSSGGRWRPTIEERVAARVHIHGVRRPRAGETGA